MFVILAGGGAFSFGKGPLRSRVISLVAEGRFCPSSEKPIDQNGSAYGEHRDLKNDQAFVEIGENYPGSDAKLWFNSYWIASSGSEKGKECLMLRLLARESSLVDPPWRARLYFCERDFAKCEPSHKQLLDQYLYPARYGVSIPSSAPSR
jgi:hypothetical protein